GGPSDDHEGVAEDDAVARVRQGMRSMLRLGSAWYDVESQITAVTEKGLDPRNFILCTDDCHSGTLVNDGHMNRVVRHAIDCGCDPLVAIQMATINTASHFGMERELGSITPGRRADFIVTSSLRELPIESVFARGQCIAEHGKLLTDCPHYPWPSTARETVKLGKKLKANDFTISAPEGVSSVKAKVIGVIENQAPTKSLEFDLQVKEGNVQITEEVSYLSLVERHRGTGSVTNGFVSGFGYTGSMAIASSVAHDSHHMIVVGTDRKLMAAAANRLGEIGGGVTVWKDGSERALVELPIAGLMSDSQAAEVANKAQAIISAMIDCGCSLNNAYMQHTLLALVVIPELRISDLGLVDVTRFKLTDVVSLKP
ncbi:MAG: adenine deaminase C-terminal domain-containing protein, partial [Paracoccaceae bacterium]